MGPSSNSKPNTQRLIRDLQSAMELRHFLFLSELDEEFVRQEGQIVFAIDSNLIHKQFTPNPDSGYLKKLRQLFCIVQGPDQRHPSDEEEKLARVIISYLIRDKNSGARRNFEPIIWLPGHLSEAKKAYKGIIGEFDQHVPRSQKIKNELQGSLKTFNRLKDSGAKKDLVLELEENFYRMTAELREPHEKFIEYSNLMAKGRLQSMKAASRNPALSDYENPFSKKSIFDDFVTFGEENSSPHEGSSAWWESRLANNLPEGFIRHDKQALYTLDRMNRLLAPHNKRVVLLTDNLLLFRLGQKYRPFKHKDRELGKLSFSDLYVRHPRCYIGDEDAINVHLPADEAVDLRLWLDTTISTATGMNYGNLLEFKRLIRPIYTDPSKLQKAADRSKRNFTDFHANLYGNWKRFLNGVTLVNATNSHEVRSVFSKYFENSDISERALLTEYEQFAKRLSEDSWAAFFNAAMQAGSDVISSDSSIPAPRNVPILLLRGMGEIGDKLSSIGKEAGVLLGDEEIRSLVYLVGNQGDQVHNYVSSLCYAYLFAHSGSWAEARLLSNRALDVAKAYTTDNREQPISPGSITGREAAYIAAVCHRMTAKSADDVSKCYDLLDQAKEAMNREGAPADESPKMTGVRFRAETIACRMAEVLFSAQENDFEFDNDEAKLAAVLALVRDANEELTKASDCDDEIICRTSKIGLRGNIYMAFALLEKNGALTDKHREALSQMLSPQLNDLEYVFGVSPGQIELSALDIYLVSYGASFDMAVDERLASIEDTFMKLEARADNYSSISVMSYDRQRFALLSSLIETR